jgi:hypothetical protein
VQSEFFADSGAPDNIPEDLQEQYGRDARKTIRRNLSRRGRVTRRAARAGRLLRSTNGELWQTTAVVFFLAVIAVCGIGGLAYAVYLWPRIGLSLVGGVVALFLFSFVIARRIMRSHQPEEEITLF